MRVALAVRDRGRARRVRQDDAPCALGRGRSASVRVGRARRRETTTPSCSCATSRPRFTASNRSRRRCSRRCRAQADRPGRSAFRASAARWPRCERPLVLVLDDLHAVANPSCLDVLAALFEYVPAGSQIAIASREEPGAAACPLAGARAGARDRRRRTSGSTSARPGCCCEPRESSSTRASSSELTERTEGWPAGLYLAALSMQAGRAELGRAPRASPATTGSCPSTSASSSCPGCRRPRRGSSSTPRCWIACAAACATPCSQTTRSADLLEALERDERLRRAPRPARRVVSLSPPVRRAAAQRARAQRAGRGGGAQPPGDGLVHRQRPDRGGGRSTGTPRARRTPSPAWSTALPCRSTTTAGWRPWRSGSGGSARTSWCGYPALAVYGAWIRVLTGRPADAERWLALADGATSTIPLLGWQRHDRAVGRHSARAHDAGRCRAGARRRESGARSAPTGKRVDRRLRSSCRGVAHALLGATDRATDDLTAVDRGRRRPSAPPSDDVSLAQAQLALLRGQARRLGRGRANAHGRPRRWSTRRASATTRRSALVARGDGTGRTPRGATRGGASGAGARPPSAAAARPRPSRGWPSKSGSSSRARISRSAKPSAARTILTETERVLELRPDLGVPGRGGAGAARPRGGDLRARPVPGR